MTPFFSIIIPVYNVALYLRECLDSILAQTFNDWEAICVDDGSTDGSSEILDEYAKKDKRFKIIHQCNKGICWTRCVALDVASGIWIAACDSDDEVKPNWLQHFYEVIIFNDAEYYWTDFSKRYLNGNEYVVKQKGIEDADWLIKENVFGKIFGGMVNKIYKRDFIIKNNIHFPRNRIHSREDAYFMCAYLEKHPRVKYINVSDYVYKLRKGSLTYHGVMPSLEQELLLEEEIETCLSEVKYKDLIEFRRQQLKYGFYDREDISDKTFYNLYPEVTSANLLNVPKHHKFLFFIATHRGRWFVLRILLIKRLFFKVFK